MGMIVALGVPIAICFLGIMNELPLTWVPLVSSISAVVTTPMRRWLDSDKVGANVGASLAIKVPLQILRLIGTIGFWASLGVLIFWIASGQKL